MLVPSASAAPGRRATIHRLNPSSAELYKQIVRDLPLGLAVIHLRSGRDPKAWELVARNAIAARAAGSSVADFLSLAVAGQDLPTAGLARLYHQVIAQRRARTLGQIRRTNRSRSPEIYAVKACPLPSNCVGIVFEEVSQLNATTHELIEAESLLKHMCESASAIAWRADPVTLEFTYMAPQTRKILGYWVERWRNEASFWKNHLHPDDWDIVKTRCLETASNGGEAQFNCRMFTAQGQLRWLHVHAQRTEFFSSRIELTGVMVDITDQKRVEQAMRRLSAQVMRVQEQERKRVSRDLHDSIGQYLTGIRFMLSDLRNRHHGHEKQQEKLKECIELVRTCIEEVRSVSHMLHPPELELLGLVEALRSYCKTFSHRAGIVVELELPEIQERLNNDTEIALFRIVQECLTNVQRHAQSDSACLRLGFEPLAVTLEVEDRGIGTDPGLLEGLERGTAEGGIGLLKMRERVHELGGKLTIHSNGQGTLVRVQLPRAKGGPEVENAADPKAIAHTGPNLQRNS